MRQVKLVVRGGGLVAEVTVAPFQDDLMPEVIIWGERFFVPVGASKDVYREAFGYAVPLEQDVVI